MSYKCTPTHPGVFLKRQVLPAQLLTKDWLRELLPDSDIDSFIAGKTPITYLMAGRLAAALGTSTKFWLDMQENYDNAVKK